MPDRSRQKERKRLKRKRKQQDRRRAASVSPFQAISRVAGQVQCWMNPNWKDVRQASIFVLRQTRSGRCAMAAFLVDQGMAGLKDAWGRIDITSSEFFDDILDPFIERMSLEPAKLSEVIPLVAAGIRFAHDNGFRLPHQYERWLKILGDIGDWHTADTSDFIMEFVGSEDDLRRRLIGQPFEEFLARTDVSIVLADNAPSVLSDEDIEFAEKIDRGRQDAVERVRQWCWANGKAPSTMLDRGWEIYSESVSAALGSEEDLEERDISEVGDEIQALVTQHLLFEPPDQREEISAAIKQVSECVVANLNTENPFGIEDQN